MIRLDCMEAQPPDVTEGPWLAALRVAGVLFLQLERWMEAY
jgi:hypothetical protein